MWYNNIQLNEFSFNWFRGHFVVNCSLPQVYWTENQWISNWNQLSRNNIHYTIYNAIWEYHNKHTAIDLIGESLLVILHHNVCVCILYMQCAFDHTERKKCYSIHPVERIICFNLFLSRSRSFSLLIRQYLIACQISVTKKKRDESVFVFHSRRKEAFIIFRKFKRRSKHA